MTGKQEILQFARLIQRNSSLFRRGSKHSILDTKNQRDLLLEVARRHAAFWQKPIDCLRVFGSRPERNLMKASTAIALIATTQKANLFRILQTDRAGRGWVNE